VFDDIEIFYNATRRHCTLGMLSPTRYEERHSLKQLNNDHNKKRGPEHQVREPAAVAAALVGDLRTPPTRALSSVFRRSAGRRTASESRWRWRRSRRRCCDHGEWCRRDERRERPPRLPRRTREPQLRRAGGGIAHARPSLANGPPSRHDETGRSRVSSEFRRVPTGRCQTVGTDMGICHVTAVLTPSDGSRGRAQNMKKPRLAGLFPMRPRRLELPRTIRSTRPSTLRVYQFRHRRVGGQYNLGFAAGRNVGFMASARGRGICSRGVGG
jgi:hypothetical protein